MVQMKAKICFVLILALVFSFVKAQYNTRLALQLGYMNQVSKQDPALIANWTCPSCGAYPIQNPVVFSNSSSKILGFLGYSSDLDTIIISFRSTDNTKNWISNIDTIRVNYPDPNCKDCSVHKGFQLAYKSVQGTFLSSFNSIRSMHANSKIIVSGHSLGGALAVFCSLDLRTLGFNIDSLYTFGQPRVGNKNFATYFNNIFTNVYRLNHYSDIVPHLPGLLFGFEHGQIQTWYTKDMQNYNLYPPEDPKGSNSLGTFGYGTSDHSLQEYLKLRVDNSIESYAKNLFLRLRQFFMRLFNRDLQMKQIALQEYEKILECFKRQGIDHKNIEIERF